MAPAAENMGSLAVFNKPCISHGMAGAARSAPAAPAPGRCPGCRRRRTRHSPPPQWPGRSETPPPDRASPDCVWSCAAPAGPTASRYGGIRWIRPFAAGAYSSNRIRGWSMVWRHVEGARVFKVLRSACKPHRSWQLGSWFQTVEPSTK